MLGHAHDDPQHLTPSERHHQHRTDLNALAQANGQAVVERPAQRTGSRHRLDLGNGAPPIIPRPLSQRPAASLLNALRAPPVGALPGEVVVVAPECP